ncbi:MAG: nucleotidyltransferase family protein [Rhodovarius sp.]|nr:nucleotidyltransferase family protein [Rhodovarius sp.]MCX7932001.1 nucleotidyltransferase family protein [Rhodovarius sp.]MDW8315706.1 nucleotidyltransferase family protein [Rhodovarius sp.]
MKGMVLAAGLGTRMRPLTLSTAKPLLALRGRSLLDHALDRLAEAGVEEAVVNAHWHAAQVAAAVAGRERPRVRLQLEPELLETGGGVRRALPLLGPAPFFVVNGDAFWLDGPVPALTRLARSFDPARMDALLLMVPAAKVPHAPPRGDFLMDPWGQLRRPAEREIAPFLFAGVQMLRPELLAMEPEEPFSLNRSYDRAAEAGRLFGLVHDGVWFHLSTPADLAAAERQLARLGW